MQARSESTQRTPQPDLGALHHQHVDLHWYAQDRLLVADGRCDHGRVLGLRDQVQEVADFFASHEADFEKNKRKIEQTLESMKTNTQYLDQFKASGALAWLQAHAK